MNGKTHLTWQSHQLLYSLDQYWRLGANNNQVFLRRHAFSGALTFSFHYFPSQTSDAQVLPMASNFMFCVFASIFFIFSFLALLKVFKSKGQELPLPPGALGWPTWRCIGETVHLYYQNPTVFFASNPKRYGFIYFSQGQKLVLLAYMLKAIKSILSNIISIAKNSLLSLNERIMVTSQDMRTPVPVGFPKSMKKLGMLVMKARPFALTLLLLSAKAAGKTPTLEYGIISNAPPSRSTHPPVNHPTRSCNAENYCRYYTLTAENPKNSIGTRVEGFVMVDVGAPLNSSAPGLEAIAGGIAKWSLKNTKSGWLSVAMNATADADEAIVSQLKLAVCRGIAGKELDVHYRSGSMSVSPANENITITVGAAANRVGLKFMTHAECFGETDVTWILEYAKANISAGGQ